MVDPISDVGSIDEDEAPSCEVCGETIVEDPDHRVVTWVENGIVQHRHFCSDACRDSWLESSEPSPE